MYCISNLNSNISASFLHQSKTKQTKKKNFLLKPNQTKNIFNLQSPDTQAWQNDYLQGTGCEMYTETLSPSFTGMTFPQASE